MSSGAHAARRFIQSTVKVSPARKAPQFAALVLGGKGVIPVYVAVKAGGGPNSVGWSIGTQPFHQGGGVLGKLAPAPGDLPARSSPFTTAPW